MRGKLILFAPSRGTLKSDFRQGSSTLADIPYTQSEFEKGEPILTLCAYGEDEADTFAELKILCRDFLEQYFEPAR